MVDVNGATTIGNSIVDLDGLSGITVTNVNNAAMTLNVDRVDSALNNQFDSTLNLTGLNASLIVNLNNPNDSWRMDGILNATGTQGSRQQTLQGSPVIVTGTINADNKIEFSAALDVSGTIAISDINTEVWLSQTTHVIRNTANVAGAGQLVIANNGTLLAEHGSAIDADVFSLGRLEPGTSIGTAMITADYSQQASGVLGLELAGAPGTNQDLLQVSGVVDLSGELEVTVIEGAMPSIGSVYTLLTAASVSGTFDTFTLLSDTIFRYEATLGYPGSRVTLRFTDVSMFGDFNDDLALDCTDVDALVAEIAGGGMGIQFDLNGDAAVDIADLNLWLDEAGTFNVGGPYLPGDANLDGFVDGQDFIEWNENKFTTTAAWCSGDFNADGFVDGLDFIQWNTFKFMSSASPASVPEPTAWVYLLLAIAGLFWRGCGR